MNYILVEFVQPFTLECFFFFFVEEHHKHSGKGRPAFCFFLHCPWTEGANPHSIYNHLPLKGSKSVFIAYLIAHCMCHNICNYLEAIKTSGLISSRPCLQINCIINFYYIQSWSNWQWRRMFAKHVFLIWSAEWVHKIEDSLHWNMNVCYPNLSVQCSLPRYFAITQRYLLC